MTTSRPSLRIAGGRVVDPANGVDEVRDVWISDGRVIDPPADPDARADRTIDARGYVVMPGGVDIHAHIAGPKVNASRMMRPEEARRGGGIARTPASRSGTLGSIPSSFATGYAYAGLGYTTVVDAAIPPLGARLAHLELKDTPAIDKAFLVLLANNHLALDLIREGQADRLRDYVGWILGATKGYGIKAVDPGGIEAWKQARGGVSALDDPVEHFGVTPRAILTALAGAVDELGLPHPLHVHGLNLGLPGCASTMMEVMRALDGRRAHLAHVQFHSYGGRPGEPSSIDSQVESLADYVNARDNLTVDVGQVLFGETTAMTADGPVGEYLARVTGRKWCSHDLERETGCGVVPITYSDRNLVHALQWAIGLEWYLRVEDPWKVAMSTDHPNGASFLAYPEIIALLMDRGHRADVLKGLPGGVRKRSGLADLDREYTLSEVAIITRAGPARMLGLASKGHLGPGADGDATIYAPDDDRRRMFARPRWAIKAGEALVDDGDLRATPPGEALLVAPEFDPAIEGEVEGHFNGSASIRFANFGVDPADVGRPREVPVIGPRP